MVSTREGKNMIFFPGLSFLIHITIVVVGSIVDALTLLFSKIKK
jgi:hypothetical protein